MTHQPSPEEIYCALHAQTGGRLFTVTVLDRAAGLARRVYTSHPDAYPVSGTKSMSQGEWTEQVVDRGEVFVANTVAEFAIYFPDHALIESLGCRAALNIPICVKEVIGTVNILDKEHYFAPQTMDRCIAAVEQHRDDLIWAMGQCVL
ncbi:hypothetical protein BCF46_2860 [Litoreibacter meonggei]|uniref:GAF domain-containing protein n=1 Tax=Litoreibacter meonggei TaxID=1049199 RepID=A0A497VCR0_9RHOB|nr:GAF domain-containing protein [Litoreibacter meonggei]RLJ41072.1 hypothetical protein BCF46_2860 [Litoreibacter meonggei]